MQSCQPACATGAALAPPPEISSLIINGQGSGHGRGLSAWGAYGLAVTRRHVGADPRPLLRRHGVRQRRPTRRSACGCCARQRRRRPASCRRAGRRRGNGVVVRRRPGDQGRRRHRSTCSANGAAVCPNDAATGGSTSARRHRPGHVSSTLARPDGRRARRRARPVPARTARVVHYRGAITAADRPGDRQPTGRSTTCSSRTTCGRAVTRGARRAGATPAAAPACTRCGPSPSRQRSFALSQNRYPLRRQDVRHDVVPGVRRSGLPGERRRRRRASPASRVCEAGNPTFECANTNRAVAETAGVVRTWPSGASSRPSTRRSHGPYSAGGSFPAVDDSASNVAGNPNYQWTRTVDAAGIESRYGLGHLIGAYSEPDPSSTPTACGATGSSWSAAPAPSSCRTWDFRNAFGLPSPGFTIAGVASDLS